MNIRGLQAMKMDVSSWSRRNRKWPKTTARPKHDRVSTSRSGPSHPRGGRRQTRRMGATRRMPSMSPCHHSRSRGRKLRPPWARSRTRVVEPASALAEALRAPARPRRARSRGWVRSGSKRATRRRTHAPSRAARVFPTASYRARAGLIWPIRASRKVPRSTPGHRRGSSRTAARATPLEGQTRIGWLRTAKALPTTCPRPAYRAATARFQATPARQPEPRRPGRPT